MKTPVKAEGLMFSLRLVTEADASFILDVRLEDVQRNRFIHRISNDIEVQRDWIRQYLQRDDDFYFVVHNRISDEDEGLIGLYNVESSRAEWGRWVLKSSSLAAIESLDLIAQVAFDCLGLEEIFSRTVEANEAVVSFHNSVGEKVRGVLPDFFDIDNKKYNAVEHFISRDHYKNELMFELQKKSQTVFLRYLERKIGKLELHHVGVASTNFERELSAFRLIGYRQENPDFYDAEQGVHGRFLVGGKNSGLPRIELLRNADASTTLDMWLNNKTKLYHLGILVGNFDQAMNWFSSHRAQVIRPPKQSAFFGKRICFIVLPNMLLLELIEV